jgi:hypothetical protein
LVDEYRQERQKEGSEKGHKAVEDSYNQGPALGQ